MEDITAYLNRRINAVLGLGLMDNVIVDDISGIAIIEANVDTYQVKGHSRVSGKYSHVNKLLDIPNHHVSEVKRMLIELLTAAGKLPELFDILDDNLMSPHNLFVAWNDFFRQTAPRTHAACSRKSA